MAIRTVKIKSILSYEQQISYEKEHGSGSAYGGLSIQGMTPGTGITFTNQRHSHLFYVTKDSVEHVGLVVAKRFTVERIMSDVYASVYTAIVWNQSESKFESVRYADSEFSGVWDASICEVDAPAELIAQYEESERQRKEAIEAAIIARRAEEAAQRVMDERRRIVNGKTVKVVKGRKVPVGTTGIVFWTKYDTYGLRCGIRTSDEKDNRGNWKDVVWVDAKNCAVLDENNNVI
jgi:hypothetical protein